MPLAKYSMIFGLTTAPTDLQKAQPHSGGWSEGFWFDNVILSIANLTPLFQARASCLPKQAAIIGLKIQQYAIVENKLQPQGSSASKLIVPGNSSWEATVPQAELQCSSQAPAVPNVGKINLRGIPSAQIGAGEYQPTPSFSTNLSNYFQRLVNLAGFTPGAGFIGRVLTNPSQRILSIAAGGVINLNAPIPGLAVGNWLILRKARDDNGKPIKGSFYVSAVAANAVTVMGLTQTSAKGGGTARRDQISFYNFSGPTVGRLGVKKIGRPSQSYRGRASKRAA